MNTHATNLLTQLIDGLYNATPTPELHAFKMLAAELKGAMQAQDAENDNAVAERVVTKLIEATTQKPTPDAYGWVENTGAMPECEISAIRFRHGGIEYVSDKKWSWNLTRNGIFTITHYRPA